MKIILGSQSEGRQQVLKEMGYEFEVMPANIDEKGIRHDNPKELVLALANAKADALLPRIKGDAILITGDQVIAWKDEIREKPEDEAQERYFLQTYHEAPAEVVNGTVVVNTATGKRTYAIDSNKVYFKKFPEEVIERFVKRDDLYRRAGGFSIQDASSRLYIEKVEGPVDSIVGLPKKLTENMIKEVQ